MQPPRAPGGSDAEEIVRHREESRRLDKEPARNSVRLPPGSMPNVLPSCEFRVVTPPGKLNVCRAGLYGGQVTDGMCRLCVQRGDRPPAIISLPRVALGDVVERMLMTVGVTKERVRRWLKTPYCGCKQRQDWLTQWGYRQQERVERLLNRAARWYGIT